MISSRTVFRSALMSVCSISAISGAALAQTTPPATAATDSAKIEDIIVTAQRTSQKLQTVPVAVTAFNAETLEKQGVRTVEDVQFHTPNVSIREEASIGGLTIGIRGINAGVDNFAFDSAVGVYENGVFIARGHSFAGTFYDLDGVQVLRGPQGTLFGRATPVGAILIDTASVKSDYEGYLKVTAGGGGNGIGEGADRGFYRLEGAVNIPFNDSFGMRVAGYAVSDDGWARSRVTGYRNFEKHDFGFRTSFRYNPGDNFDATLVLAYNQQHDGMPLFSPTEYIPGISVPYNDALTGTTAQRDASIALAANQKPYENESLFRDERAERKQYSASLNMAYKFSDTANLRSITGYRAIRNFQVNDLSGIAFPAGTTDTTHQDQFSQELLLNADVSEQLNIIGGLYYFQETGFEENLIKYVTLLGNTPNAFNNPLRVRGEDIKNTAASVFASATFKLTPELSIGAGARYTREKKVLTLNSAFLVVPIPYGSGTYGFKDNVIVYDAKINYQVNSDLLLYAKYGTGYRPGGVGFRGPDSAFNAEKSNTAELGGKFDFNLGSMPARLNVAVFHTKYKNFQVGVTQAVPVVRTVVVNTGSATINGLEAEFTIRPVTNLNIGVNLGLIDAKYGSFIIDDASLGGLVDFSNNKLRNAPATTLSVSASYRIETGSGDLIPSIDYSHQSTYYVDAQYQPTGPVPITRTDAFRQTPTDIVNVRLELEKAFGSNVNIGLWGKNITDQRRLSYGLNVGGLRTAVYAEPLSYGLDVRLNF